MNALSASDAAVGGGISFNVEFGKLKVNTNNHLFIG